MNNISTYILEKLVINKNIKTQSSLENRQTRENWSIENAENGDIVSWNDDTLLFIYKCLNTGNNKINNATDNAIVFHASWISDDRNILEIGIDTGVGDTSKPYLYKLAPVEKCKNFYQEIEKKGYKWDDIHKKIIKK